MSFFAVDADKCKRDGLCVAVCPFKILRQADPEAVPVPVPGGGEFCMRCGHCLAVCPHGAISLDGASPESSPPVRKEWRLDPERVEHFLRCRRTIREFKRETPDRETIARLIEIARYAPSAHNLQPVNWRVLHSPGAVRRMAGLVVDWMRDFGKAHPRQARMMHLSLITGAWDEGVDVICWEAPALILAHAPSENLFAPRDCIIAMTYLDLAAPSLGLGTCWAGYFMRAAAVWPPLQDALGLPEGHAVMGAMMAGRPKYRYQRLPPRKAPAITWM